MAPSDDDIIAAMALYGGSFIQSLAECFKKADPWNFVRLKNAFPDYWHNYGLLVLKIKGRGAGEFAENH